MAEAGYNPKAVLSFLRMIDQERALNPVDVPPYLMTHPLTQERISGVEAAIRSLRVSERGRSAQLDPIKRVQAILRFERHDSDAAIAEYRKLLSQNPVSAEPMHLLALAYHYKGRLPEAREKYEQARSLDPKIPGIDRDLGRFYTQVGEYRLAHEAFERSLTVEPKEPLTYIYLGELFERESNLSKALGAYLTAYNLSPLWAEPSQRLGVVYGKMNRLGEAYHYLGRSQLLQDEDEKAIVDLERALKIFGPDSPQGQVVQEELEAVRARRR
jgi:predicted Zn-dependent protease